MKDGEDCHGRRSSATAIQAVCRTPAGMDGPVGVHNVLVRFFLPLTAFIYTSTSSFNTFPSLCSTREKDNLSIMSRKWPSKRPDMYNCRVHRAPPSSLHSHRSRELHPSRSVPKTLFLSSIDSWDLLLHQM